MAQGHVIPMMDMAKLFVARGIKSSLITTPANALHFSKSLELYGLNIELLVLPFRPVGVGLLEGCGDRSSNTSPKMVRTFLHVLDMLQQPFHQLLGEHHPNCVVSDMFLPWMKYVADQHGIPRLVFHGTSNFSMCLLENILRYDPQKNVALDSEIFVVSGCLDKIEMTKSQFDPDGYETKNPVLDMVAQLNEIEAKSYGVLTNNFYELEPAYVEFYRKNIGRRTWNIGPVSLYNRNNDDKVHRGGKKSCIDAHSCLTWLDCKEPNSVLYISFGSNARLSAPQLFEIALRLEALGVSFIWDIRVAETKDNDLLPQGFEVIVQGRGLILRGWAPQVLILDHPAVGGFMTHCGWNSTLEGISAGVPLITWPLFTEQFFSEQLATQVLKIGIPMGNRVWIPWVELEVVSVTNERVKEVVVRLMGGGEIVEHMRRRAKDFGQTARKAMEQDGSSYMDLTDLIRDLSLQLGNFSESVFFTLAVQCPQIYI